MYLTITSLLNYKLTKHCSIYQHRWTSKLNQVHGRFKHTKLRERKERLLHESDWETERLAAITTAACYVRVSRRKTLDLAPFHVKARTWPAWITGPSCPALRNPVSAQCARGCDWLNEYGYFGWPRLNSHTTSVGRPNSKHWFTTSFLGGRCQKAMLGVCRPPSRSPYSTALSRALFKITIKDFSFPTPTSLIVSWTAGGFRWKKLQHSVLQIALVDVGYTNWAASHPVPGPAEKQWSPSFTAAVNGRKSSTFWLPTFNFLSACTVHCTSSAFLLPAKSY